MMTYTNLARSGARRNLAGLLFGLALLLGLVLLPRSAPVRAQAELCLPLTIDAELKNTHEIDYYEVVCLEDLLTPGLLATGRTDFEDWNGLHAIGTRNPTGQVPGIQIDGYFKDNSTTNPNRGWFHDSQFVIRLPNDWNGKLVITGAPGVRGQYANDYIISDWVVAPRDPQYPPDLGGYAFASIDKGNTGTNFYRDGAKPADAVMEWHRRMTQLTQATKAIVKQHYGKAAAYTYITGISNGGYLTRWQLENNPDLFDGGVDWEGTYFAAEGPNLFTYLPDALEHYPTFATDTDPKKKEDARTAMHAAGFEPGSEFLWEYHYGVYWDLTQRIYREEFDPEFDGATQAGTPFCRADARPETKCDAEYEYASRPQSVHDAVARISLSGKIGKPMILLHGTLDALLPISENAEPYAELVDQSGRSGLFRYYEVQDGNHIDALYNEYPDKLRPILPCQRSAFELLEQWVESKGERKPPKSGLLARPSSGDVVNIDIDVINICPITPIDW